MDLPNSLELLLPLLFLRHSCPLVLITATPNPDLTSTITFEVSSTLLNASHSFQKLDFHHRHQFQPTNRDGPGFVSTQHLAIHSTAAWVIISFEWSYQMLYWNCLSFNKNDPQNYDKAKALFTGFSYRHCTSHFASTANIELVYNALHRHCWRHLYFHLRCLMKRSNSAVEFCYQWGWPDLMNGQINWLIETTEVTRSKIWKVAVTESSIVGIFACRGCTHVYWMEYPRTWRRGFREALGTKITISTYCRLLVSFHCSI